MRFPVFSGCAAAIVAASFSALADPQRPAQPSAASASRTIASVLAPPPGYRRIALPVGSFGAWLRNLPLKAAGAQVHLFDGRVKPDAGVYAAVVDMDIGTSDLQQCADAVMRLRAEYLFGRREFDKIGFRFTSGFYAGYPRWRSGDRVSVNGNTVRWVSRSAPDSSYAQFRKYLETVFSYAGTMSLERELKPVPFATMQPGDVLIRGGAPGHAVTVMDMAVNGNGERCYLLGQSYMPAQDIQILRDPSRVLGGVWYSLEAASGVVVTPEWRFTTEQLRRF